MRGLQGKEYLDSILDEQEQTYLEQFCSNEKMMEAVKNALLGQLYKQGIIKWGKKANALTNFALVAASNNPDFSNEQLGAINRANWLAINMLEVAFEDMSKYKKEKVGEPKTNEAR